jgi:hypothetical protein
MRRLYANKLVVISAVLIVLLSALFALARSSARSPDPADKTATPSVALNPLAAQGRASIDQLDDAAGYSRTA